ncbi:exopolysaccharide Pel transporter PelG [Clostridium aestuarii]|uniref:Exopolysaccharide Pel transporter PelG n=1 Tax=Clostridium aestuarii TaxID=338193 RepID=A0ABT4CVC8_9CLOT|nr:exopolysaccharide Pel transporter PelG [Clostridium aestuarii]MCY6482926.1 exopolysaccharide Pel transporter PelG [Clostridium aestuarii]
MDIKKSITGIGSEAVAGIGFELKKLFKSKSFFNNIRAYLYSSLVTVGPFILCTLMITVIQILMRYMNISFVERELFLVSIVYAFIFSQIVTSGFSMIITRFISDKLYNKEFKDILPSLYGIISISVIIGAVPAIIFLVRSPLEWNIKLCSYILYMELIIMWLQSVYLSALKDYIKIVKGFLFGIVITLVLAYCLIKFSNIKAVLSLLVAMDVGIFTIIVVLMAYIKSFFSESSDKYFLFLGYFDKYPALFFVNLFYTLGLYVHNFVFWNSGLKNIIAYTYSYSPIYDVPVFYAFLSIIPSMVLFVVSVETSFYEKYRAYYSNIIGRGNLLDIKNSRKDMTNVLWAEIRNIMEFQLFFTLIFLVLGGFILTRIGLIKLSIDIFNITTLGAYANIIMLIIMLIELYFEDIKGALIISTTFLITNLTFSLITIYFGESFYGLGFFLATFITLLVGLNRLIKFLKYINHHTFCSQPIVYRETRGIFTKIVQYIYE